jgi:hypothetical protein
MLGAVVGHVDHEPEASDQDLTPRVLSMKSIAPLSKACFSLAIWAWLVRNTTGTSTPC